MKRIVIRIEGKSKGCAEQFVIRGKSRKNYVFSWNKKLNIYEYAPKNEAETTDILGDPITRYFQRFFYIPVILDVPDASPEREAHAVDCRGVGIPVGEWDDAETLNRLYLAYQAGFSAMAAKTEVNAEIASPDQHGETVVQAPPRRQRPLR